MAKVILINSFEVPQAKEDECPAFWERAAEYMRRQPGFVSTKLHRAVISGAGFHFVNVAEWESPEHFQKAVEKEEFNDLVAPYMNVFPHYPGLYEVIRT
jgi:heme oxygenase (mycobilin-producing)